MSTAPLENIYSFQSNTGLVIPDTSNVRAQVIEGLKSIFGAEDFCTDAETPNGLLIDALTQMIKDFIGITAQNVNGLNITTAIGGWLDALGGIFGIQRSDDDTDYSYRVKILQSTSRGAGFVQSVYNAIYASAVNKVSNVVVIANGKGESAILPTQEYGIEIDPHSIFISATCDTDTEMAIAQAIDSSISLGCAFHNEEGADRVEKLVNGNRIVFYHPKEKFVKIVAKVNPIAYTGTDIIGDTTNAIKAAMVGKTACAITSVGDIMFAISGSGKGIVPVSVNFYVKPSQSATWEATDSILVRPTEFINPLNMVVEVS